MRKGLLGTAALLTASHLSAAEPTQLPPSAPPPPLTLPADSILSLPPASDVQPPAGMPPAQPPAGGTQPQTQGQTPPAQGAAPPAPQAPAQAAASQGAQTANTFRDCHCGPPEWLWLGGGPFWGWVKNGPLPPLAVASTGQVLGGSPIDYRSFVGLELDGGLWLNSQHTWGLSFGGFLLEQRSVFDSLSSDAAGSPAIVRPTTNPLTAQPFNFPVSAPAGLAAAPGGQSGSVAYGTSTRFWGAEAGIAHNLFYTQDYSVDLGFGFRYLDLDESLTIDQSSTAFGAGSFNLAGNAVPSLFLEDRFQTRNQFYGGQFTTRAEYRFGPAYINLLSKIALGPNHEVLNVNGSTTGGGLTVPGGLLAVGSPTTGGNIGQNVTNRFVVVPEFGADLGVQLSCHVRASIGYHFIYINDVIRPGSQIDTVVNQALVPSSSNFGTLSGPNTPRITGQHDEFYAHGVLFRLETKW